MFALIFTVDDKKYGIDVEDIVSVAPAFDLIEDSSHPLPFAGWREYKDGKIPVFDLKYALNGICVKRLFGTRHIIANCKFGEKKLRVALAAEGLESVSEFVDEFEIAVNTPLRTVENNEYGKVALVDIALVLKGVVFDYERA